MSLNPTEIIQETASVLNMCRHLGISDKVYTVYIVFNNVSSLETI